MTSAAQFFRQTELPGRPLRLIVTVAVLYFAFGAVALLLAIPPGYAASVWPAAGVAVAAIVLAGPSIWPGIFIGSLSINLWIGLQAGDPWQLSAFVAATSIAAGATLQALLGALLVRRMSSGRPDLFTASQVTRLLVAAGPLACIVNASIGTLTLLGLGIVQSDQFAFNWWNWWIGDTIGVVVVAPLALIWSGRLGIAWQSQRLQITLPIVIAMILVVTSFVTASRREQLRIDAEFRNAATAVTASLQQELSSVTDALMSLRTFYDSSDYVSRAEFRKFAGGLLANHKELVALSWNVYVPDRERELYELTPLRGDSTVIRFLERNASGDLVPAAKADNYVVVHYIEPMEQHTAAIGFNVLAEPVRNAALTQALGSGMPTATGRISLVQHAHDHAGILVFSPVYDQLRAGNTDNPPTPRGFVVAVILVRDLLANAIDDLPVSDINMTLQDASSQSDQLLGSIVSSDTSNALIEVVNELPFAGRSWQLSLSAGSSFVAAHRSASLWLILAGGMLLSGMLGAFLVLLTGHAIRERTRLEELEFVNAALADNIQWRQTVEKELSSEKARAEATLNSIADGVISVGADRLIEFMNPVAEALTGWCQSDAQGKSLGEVLVLDTGDPQHTQADTLDLCLEHNDRKFHQGELWLTSRHGSRYALRQSTRSLGPSDDQVAGFVIAFQDVTAERREAREITHRATHDTLTGLVNRAEFERCLVDTIDKISNSATLHALLFMDLDHFKIVNDTAGHAVGDELLRSLFNDVRQKVRSADTLGRLGGDEFGLLLPYCPRERAAAIADSLLELVNNFRLVLGRNVFQVGISIGVTMIDSSDHDPAAVMKRADAACYEAKKNGRNQIIFFGAENSVAKQESLSA